MNFSITGWTEADTLYNSAFIPSGNTPVITIKVNLHIIQDQDGENNFCEENEDHMIYLNSLFREDWSKSVNGLMKNIPNLIWQGDTLLEYHIEDSRIRFSVENKYFHQDDGGLAEKNSHWDYRNYFLENFSVNPETEINIFLSPTHPTENSSIGGYGPPGGSSTNPPYLGTVTLYNIYQNFINNPLDQYPYGGSPWAVNPLIVHEFGHVFGLHHTNLENRSYLRFYPELPWPEEFYWCSPSSDSYCSNNVMGGSNSKRYLSPLQIGHIHRIFASNPARIRYLKSCEYNPDKDIVIESGEGIDPKNDEPIGPNVVEWNSPKVVSGNITIEEDAVLIVRCLLSMPNNGKIIVKPGGRLEIDGGIITNSCGENWSGVFVEGDPTLNQTYANQGAVILSNGAIIENASTGVSTRSVDSNWDHNGGIVVANNATFRNNYRDVAFYAYQNLDHSGNEMDNVSSFTNCTFKTTEKTPFDNHTNHISMWRVKGVSIENSIFQDFRSVLRAQKRKGVKTSTASFSIDNSEFNNLLYGIYASSSDVGATFDVENSEFSSYKGIFFNAIDHVRILNNQFYVIPGYEYDDGPKCENTYGIYVHHSNSFQIEDNVFTSTLANTDHCGSVGIVAKNTGSTRNEILRNAFDGFTVGIEAIGMNRGERGYEGLALLCSDFNNNKYDIFVTPGDGWADYQKLGIRGNQGSYAPEQAGNLFGNDSPILSSNFINDCRDIHYFMHDPSSEPRVEPSIFDEYSINIYNMNTDFYGSEICNPSSGGSRDQLVDEVNANRDIYLQTNEQLNNTVDYGDTEMLETEVEGADEYTAYNTYLNLIQLSSYISKEVLKSLSSKEEGFNQAMIRDVLVNTPHAAKSQVINQILDERKNLLPWYMRMQINQGVSNFGDKEILLNQKGTHKNLYDNALKNLMAIDIRSRDQSHLQELKTILQESPEINNRFLLAELEFSQNNFTNGFQVLNTIEQEFSFNDPYLQEKHMDYLNFYETIQDWSLENLGFIGLTEIQKDYLTDFLEKNHRIAGKALSILIKNQGVDFEEVVYLPAEEVSPKSDPFDQPSRLKPEIESHIEFSIFPNPGVNFITLNWCNENGNLKGGKIDFYTAAGHHHHTFVIDIQCNQKIMDISNWKPGQYLGILKSPCGQKKTIPFIILN